MAKTKLTAQQLNDLVDIIGGLYHLEGKEPTEEPSRQEENKEAPPAQQAEAGLPQAPALPMQAPGLGQAPALQTPRVAPSPFAQWHKGLGRYRKKDEPLEAKEEKPKTPSTTQPPQPEEETVEPAPNQPAQIKRLQTPQVPLSPFSKALQIPRGMPKPLAARPMHPHSVHDKTPQTHPPTINSLFRQRPERPPMAQPYQETPPPASQPPRDQPNILDRIQSQAAPGKSQPGTDLAHIIRRRDVDPSIAAQFEVMGVDSLRTLKDIINRQKPTLGVNLTRFHDDSSPFVVVSQPRQSLRQGNIPAVVVGKPYAGLVHQLESAFPGVHFFTADSAGMELKRAAAMTAKPLGQKSLHHKYRIKAEDDQTSTPEKPSTPPSPPLPKQAEEIEEVADQPETLAPTSTPTAPTPPPAAPEPPPEHNESPESEAQTELHEDADKQQVEEHAPESANTPPLFQPIQYSFLESIKSDPTDTAPRLIYADWLEENNQPDLAEVIRIQTNYEQVRNTIHVTERVLLELDRAGEIIDQHPEWFYPWGRARHDILDEGATLRDGMLQVHMQANDFMSALNNVSDPHKALAMVQTVHFVDSTPEGVVLALRSQRSSREPLWFPYISSLDLAYNHGLGDYASSVAYALTSPELQNLWSLDLSYTGFGRFALAEDMRRGDDWIGLSEENAQAVKDLVNSQALNNLKVLNLSYNNLSPESINHLIEAKGLQNIERLDIRGNQVTEEQRELLHQRYGQNIIIQPPEDDLLDF